MSSGTETALRAPLTVAEFLASGHRLDPELRQMLRRLVSEARLRRAQELDRDDMLDECVLCGAPLHQTYTDRRRKFCCDNHRKQHFQLYSSGRGRGRPRIAPDAVSRIVALRVAGLSQRQIADATGVSKSTVGVYVKEAA